MADYKELLRRAIKALPENNGAARRGVYEKARTALVSQLRAITPPLPAKDITQHRLHLEDCIRQVEQEASEAILTLKRQDETPRPPRARPEPKSEPKPEAALAAPVAATRDPVVLPPPGSIEEIIHHAQEASPPPSMETPKVNGASAAPPVPPRPERERPAPAVPFEPRRGNGRDGGAAVAVMTSPVPRFDSMRAQATAAVPELVGATAAVQPAMSAVREVEVDASETADPQVAIDRAIAALDREARGETAAVPPTTRIEVPSSAAAERDITDEADAISSMPAAALPRGIERERSGSAITIFLIVLVVLLAGAAGGGWWAVQNGYLDLQAMFGRAETPVVSGTAIADVQTSQPTLETSAAGDVDAVSAPGNTEPAAEVPAPSAELTTDERLPATDPEFAAIPEAETTIPGPSTSVLPPLPETPTGDEPLALVPSTNGATADERLPAAAAEQLASTPSLDSAAVPGSQSLLLELEVADTGARSAVPFSGSVTWSEGTDEVGLPTIVGTASIPARNLDIEITIRKNADPTLPASHLMEIWFDVSDTFIGGSVASLPGVLLKNEELVGGTPLVGASARVTANRFLFALSASANDSANNVNLLTSQRWLDLAVVYGTGKQAMVSLEKDDAAQALFTEVFSAWQNTASN